MSVQMLLPDKSWGTKTAFVDKTVWKGGSKKGILHSTKKKLLTCIDRFFWKCERGHRRVLDVILIPSEFSITWQKSSSSFFIKFDCKSKEKIFFKCIQALNRIGFSAGINPYVSPEMYFSELTSDHESHLFSATVLGLYTYYCFTTTMV